MLFTTTVPKFKLVGLALAAPCVAPVPDNGSDSEGFGASEVTVTVPVALPAVEGANVTVNVALCDAPIATGAVKPLTWNPVPLTET